jgi:hypothetical protein
MEAGESSEHPYWLKFFYLWCKADLSVVFEPYCKLKRSSHTGPEFFFVQTVFLRLAWKMRKGGEGTLGQSSFLYRQFF